MMKRSLLVGLMLPMSSVWADGVPWLGAPGSTSLSVSVIHQNADKLYAGTSETALPADLEQQTYQINVSRVLSDNVAVDAALGYAESELDDSGPGRATDGGITDTRLGVLWRVNDEFLNAALPSIALRGVVTLAGDYNGSEIQAIGDEANGLEGSVIVGRIFAQRYAASAEVGYRWRDSSVDDEYFIALGLYAQFSPKWRGSLGYQMRDANGDTDINSDRFTASNDDFRLVEEDNATLDVGIAYQLNPKVSASFNYGRVVDGRNTAISDIFALGLGYNF